MKRSDFFKSLMALPLISLFVKESAKAETPEIPEGPYCMRFNRHTRDIIYDSNPGGGWVKGFIDRSCKHEFGLWNNQSDPKQNGFRCMKCGIRATPYREFNADGIDNCKITFHGEYVTVEPLDPIEVWNINHPGITTLTQSKWKL